MTRLQAPPADLRTDLLVISRLGQLCHDALAQLDVDGVAVSVMRGHSLSLAASTDEDYGRLERTQHFHSKGATVLAQSTHVDVAVAELDRHEPQWPEFCDLARRLGVHSVLAVPIGPPRAVDLVLSLYCRSPRRWSPFNVAKAIQLARRMRWYLTEPLRDAYATDEQKDYRSGA